MTGFRFRLVDTAGSELAIVSYAVPSIGEGETVYLPGVDHADTVVMIRARVKVTPAAKRRKASMSRRSCIRERA